MNFEFGQPVDKKLFVNRTSEIERLQRNIDAKLNTVLISPRRWGKSSLVQQVDHLNTNPKQVFVVLDLFKVRSEEQFYEAYSNAIIKATNSKLEEFMTAAKTWLAQYSPAIKLNPTGESEVELSLARSKNKLDYSAILDLAENIAQSKGIQLIVCLDEFQNISTFDDPLAFQKAARAHWQQHKNVSYLLYGSKRHMMMDLFESKSMPFYRFGDTIYLTKIGAVHFVPFIKKVFSSSGKKIPKNIAHKLVETMEEHPYYVQQLSFILWHKVYSGKVTESDFEKALNELIKTNAIFYSKEFDDLPDTQIRCLKMIADGHENGFTKGDRMQEYGFKSSAHVSTAMNALHKKELIDSLDSKTEFIDPVFKLWFQKTIT
ncbi:MAG: ATP-binding protein [Salibacteraceae bacterium]